MGKDQQIVKSCRVQVNGRNYCLWKIPDSENPEVRNSALSSLIRNVTLETLENVKETARDLIFYDKTKFGYTCDRTSTKGCKVFKGYENNLKLQNKILPHIPGTLQSIE